MALSVPFKKSKTCPPVVRPNRAGCRFSKIQDLPPLCGHLNPASSGSQFSLSKDCLISLLQSKQVVGSPITRVLDGGNFLRQVNVGRNIGFDKFNGNKAASTLSVITDKFGNLVTATPGVIK